MMQANLHMKFALYANSIICFILKMCLSCSLTMKTLVLMLYLFESGTYIRSYGEKYGFS